MNLHNVIQAPLVTEKTEEIKVPRHDVVRYTMRVHPDANKESIRQALYHIYKVKVTKVNIMRVPGKKKRFRSSKIKLSPWKKAMVTLAAGQSIDFAKTTD